MPMRKKTTETAVNEKRTGRVVKFPFHRDHREDVEEAEAEQEARPPGGDGGLLPDDVQEVRHFRVERIGGVPGGRQFQGVFDGGGNEHPEERIGSLSKRSRAWAPLVLNVVELEDMIDRLGGRSGMADDIPGAGNRPRREKKGEQEEDGLTDGQALPFPIQVLRTRPIALIASDSRARYDSIKTFPRSRRRRCRPFCL